MNNFDKNKILNEIGKNSGGKIDMNALSAAAPNSVLMLSVFAHLCEAYLGIRPSLELWRFY